MVALRKPFFVVPLDLDIVSWTPTFPGYPASHLNRLDAMGLVWLAEGPDYAAVQGRLPEGSAVDFMGVINGGIYTQSGFRLRLANSQAELSGPSPAYDSGYLPYLGAHTYQADGRYHAHHELPNEVSASWFWLELGGGGGRHELGGLVFGKKIEPSRFYDKDFERGTEDLGSVELNRFAVPDYTPGTKLRTLNFTLGWLNEAEYETQFAPFAELVGTTTVVFCCFDPALSPYRQNRTYLGWLRNPPFARGGAKPRTYSMEFQIRSLI